MFNVDDILVIVILAVLLMYVYRGCACRSSGSSGSSVKMIAPKSIDNGINGNELKSVSERPIETMSSVSNSSDGMAPLDFGTFYNNYPRGQCQTGKFSERKSCEVGNCPLGSTISDQQFCRIQCAQDPDATERQKCLDVCMKNLC